MKKLLIVAFIVIVFMAGTLLFLVTRPSPEQAGIDQTIFEVDSRLKELSDDDFANLDIDDLDY
ncbi:MAG TPA: hypothetical protein VJ065_00410 [Patescibacteria group bacterium]|nr:hypothetical protein [Patescibacteria group bacterium]